MTDNPPTNARLARQFSSWFFQRPPGEGTRPTPPQNGPLDRGRSKGLNLAPPSEPDRRVSRIRLSSQWVRNATIVRVHSCSAFKLSSPRRANHSFGQR